MGRIAYRRLLTPPPERGIPAGRARGWGAYDGTAGGVVTNHRNRFVGTDGGDGTLMRPGLPGATVAPRTERMKAKVSLVGEAAVGKTSMVRRFVLDEFEDRDVTTLGATSRGTPRSRSSTSGSRPCSGSPASSPSSTR